MTFLPKCDRCGALMPQFVAGPVDVPDPKAVSGYRSEYICMACSGSTTVAAVTLRPDVDLAAELSKERDRRTAMEPKLNGLTSALWERNARIYGLTKELEVSRRLWSDRYTARGRELDAQVEAAEIIRDRLDRAEAEVAACIQKQKENEERYRAGIEAQGQLADALAAKDAAETQAKGDRARYDICNAMRKMYAKKVEQLREDAKEDAAQIQQLVEGMQKATEKLSEHEQSLNTTIDHRDAHEERINNIRDALGLDCEWSSACDVGAECVEEIGRLRERVHQAEQKALDASSIKDNE